MFCVRVVFLLYAGDALHNLFDILDRKDIYLEAGLKAFPYVNGGLFQELDTDFPPA